MFDACNQEQVQVTVAVTAVGGTPVRIFKNPAGTAEIVEISLQPVADAHLQIFEGNGQNAITALRFVQQFLLWSCPGKKYVQDDLFLVIAEGNVTVNVDVRYIPRVN